LGRGKVAQLNPPLELSLHSVNGVLSSQLMKKRLYISF